MAELDRTKPFQTAFGIVKEDEAFYFQDGKSFYPNGQEVVAEAPAVEVITEEPVEEEPVEEAPVAPVAEEKPVKKRKARTQVTQEAITEDDNHDLL